MPIDQNFATLSDRLFEGTCVVYVVALLAALAYYILEQKLIALRADGSGE